MCLIRQCEGGFQNRCILSLAQDSVSTSNLESNVNPSFYLLCGEEGVGKGGFWKKRARDEQRGKHTHSATDRQTHRQIERGIDRGKTK